MLETMAFGLDGLTGGELARVRGGDLIPNECDIDMMWCVAGAAAWAVISFFRTAPASSYAYGKVGYTS